MLSRPLFKISQQGIAAQSKSGDISDVGDGNTQERSKGIGGPQGQVDHEEFGKLREKLGQKCLKWDLFGEFCLGNHKIGESQNH